MVAAKQFLEQQHGKQVVLLLGGCCARLGNIRGVVDMPGLKGLHHKGKWSHYQHLAAIAPYVWLQYSTHLSDGFAQYVWLSHWTTLLFRTRRLTCAGCWLL